MKKGKTSKLDLFKDAKCYYGSVDTSELKSLYLVLQTWVTPKIEKENWNTTVGSISRTIKHKILEVLDKDVFREQFIVDLDLRTSGINLKKKSFMNLEITLFTQELELDFKSPELKKVLKKLTKDIYSDVFISHDYFKFYLTKHGNSKPIKVKTENI